MPHRLTPLQYLIQCWYTIYSPKPECLCRQIHNNVMRGLRLNMNKFINNFKRRDLEKAQLDMACLYNKQRSITKCKGNSIKASSSSLHELWFSSMTLKGFSSPWVRRRMPSVLEVSTW